MTTKTKWTLKQAIVRCPYIPLRFCPICIAKNTNLHDRRNFFRSSSWSRSLYKGQWESVLLWFVICLVPRDLQWRLRCLQTLTSTLFWYANLSFSVQSMKSADLKGMWLWKVSMSVELRHFTFPPTAVFFSLPYLGCSLEFSGHGSTRETCEGNEKANERPSMTLYC